ncbi:hypothetical protein [Providencia manganoxydans]|uniref:hypothetical protein n=1 Tax=Providencia manganoxydans TaxID=2923283 RepID=UPI0034E606BD
MKLNNNINTIVNDYSLYKENVSDLYKKVRTFYNENRDGGKYSEISKVMRDITHFIQLKYESLGEIKQKTAEKEQLNASMNNSSFDDLYRVEITRLNQDIKENEVLFNEYNVELSSLLYEKTRILNALSNDDSNGEREISAIPSSIMDISRLINNVSATEEAFIEQLNVLRKNIDITSNEMMTVFDSISTVIDMIPVLDGISDMLGLSESSALQHIEATRNILPFILKN